MNGNRQLLRRCQFGNGYFGRGSGRMRRVYPGWHSFRIGNWAWNSISSFRFCPHKFRTTGGCRLGWANTRFEP